MVVMENSIDKQVIDDMKKKKQDIVDNKKIVRK